VDLIENILGKTNGKKLNITLIYQKDLIKNMKLVG